MSESDQEEQRSPATGRQMAKGAAWMMTFKLVDRSIGLLSTIILARLLTPADFGLVAMATAVVALTELMGAFGFDTALIQRQNVRNAHYNTAWTFNILFSISIATLLLILAGVAADFYREPRLAEILPILALGAFVSGFENIGTVTFRKELNFRKEFLFLLSKRVASFTVTLTLAFMFRTFWALVAGIVTGKLVSVMISYLLHPYRPRLDLSARNDLLHFSKWLFFSNLIQFLHSRSTDFILGRTVGSHGLGIYNVAAEIAALPATELIAPLNRAVYPAYARLATQLEDLKRRFLEVFGLIALIALPVSFGIVSVAEPAVRLMLGPQWMEAVPLIRIIALSGLVGALQSNMYLVIVALGKPKINTLLGSALLVITLPTIVIASMQYGILGAAWAHFSVSALLGLTGIGFVFTRITQIKVRSLLNKLVRPTLAATVMASALLMIDTWLVAGPEESLAITRLLILVPAGAMIYVGTVLSLWLLAGRPNSAEEILLNIMKEKLAKRQ